MMTPSSRVVATRVASRGGRPFSNLSKKLCTVASSSIRPTTQFAAATFPTVRQPVKSSFLPQSSNARVLSTAAAAAVEDAPSLPRRRTLETKDPLIVTERAADRIKELLQGESAESALGIRLGVKRRGCNGLSYTLNYAFEKPVKDLEMEAHGVTVFIEPMALFNVVGTVMDWEESDLASEFTFNNPNSKGECGCGESFTV